jgi:hypothetical protein
MKMIWIFIVLLGALFLTSILGNTLEGFTAATDGSGNYVTHSQFGTSTFTELTDASGNTSYDNYNHYDGTSSALVNGAIYYGPNGGSATVITTSDGKQAIRIIFPNDPTPVTYTYVTVNKWTGPNGEATLVQSSTGEKVLKVTMYNGQTYIFTINPQSAQSSSQSANYQTTYFGSTGSPPPPQSDYYNYNMGSSPSTTTPSSSSSYMYPSDSSSASGSGGGMGIPRNMIPPGQEDLYVLKSSIVPPVCPACPPVIQSDSSAAASKTCPPCPACARCPEPQFDCKKVPNYSQSNTSLPNPVLNDFSSFGL